MFPVAESASVFRPPTSKVDRASFVEFPRMRLLFLLRRDFATTLDITSTDFRSRTRLKRCSGRQDLPGGDGIAAGLTMPTILLIFGLRRPVGAFPIHKLKFFHPKTKLAKRVKSGEGHGLIAC
jgi:hypothetical protein